MESEELKPNSMVNQPLAMESPLLVFTKGVISAVKNGELNPLEAKAIASVLKNLGEKIEEEIVQEVLVETSKYPNREFNYKGYTFVKSQKTTYKYDDDRINMLEEEISKRKKMLQNITEPVVLPETGEILNPAVKKVTEYVYIKKSEK